MKNTRPVKSGKRKLVIMTAKQSGELSRKAQGRAAFADIMEQRGQYLPKIARSKRAYDRKKFKDKRDW